MPVMSLDASSALANLGHIARWPTTVGQEDRLRPVARPCHSPGFRIEQDDRIYTIGSCFARHIESHLAEKGFTLPTLDAAIPRWQGWSNGVLNKYVPHAILNELVWALEPGADSPASEERFFRLENGRWIDPHTHCPVPLVYDEVVRRRAIVSDVTKRVRECRIVIVTLGLVEAWWDRRLDAYLNTKPPSEVILRAPDRFRFDVLSVVDVIEALERVHALLRQHCLPGYRLMVTVSPVPLGATFSGRDVLVANAYSKSVLRVAADDFARRHEDVDYFPSYESVTMSDATLAWKDDGLHVSDALVRMNVERMVEAYCAAD